jgi:hypothetical protein
LIVSPATTNEAPTAPWTVAQSSSDATAVDGMKISAKRFHRTRPCSRMYRLPIDGSRFVLRSMMIFVRAINRPRRSFALNRCDARDFMTGDSPLGAFAVCRIHPFKGLNVRGRHTAK